MFDIILKQNSNINCRKKREKQRKQTTYLKTHLTSSHPWQSVTGHSWCLKSACPEQQMHEKHQLDPIPKQYMWMLRLTKSIGSRQNLQEYMSLLHASKQSVCQAVSLPWSFTLFKTAPLFGINKRHNILLPGPRRQAQAVLISRKGHVAKEQDEDRDTSQAPSRWSSHRGVRTPRRSVTWREIKRMSSLRGKRKNGFAHYV